MAPYQRSNDTRNATVIHLFPKGITRTEIARLIEKMLHASKKSVSEQVKAFHQRPLHTRYICVYVDTTYIAVGICEDKSKEVLAYTIAPTESAYNWQELLEELKDRGCKGCPSVYFRWLQRHGRCHLKRIFKSQISILFSPYSPQFITQNS
ncbi:hypothetical protein CG478_009010 [Bacillus cytotoxicus]|nr:hypothetical protein CG483_006250 [Bacillus cytotoxicus]AWC40615.1 hypothetical protein CG480_009010 [Bacillus cytotoxicus]AWC48546.1 hypothetical protein CG478_009010 [Bacillus cytotoxicus]AWC52068.1 hypothetical protein CG477_006200 [Bacillus cytotoxicus]AWC56204.1 hypothetical protein CG476_006240 [Bacillus cytotoxicus]